MSTRMPVMFFGHGNPMNAIEPTPYGRAWRRIGEQLPRPRAILSISAHWYVPAVLLTTSDAPRTIHDFGGFPRALYETRYPAPGDPQLAGAVAKHLSDYGARGDERWGLDHGTWSVLGHVYPQADIPVVQLSIDERLPASEHYAIGRALRPFRDEGVLVMASGNVVHNLHAFAWGDHRAEPFAWARRFEGLVRESLASGNHEPLVAYESLGEDARLCAPTPDHFLPLLYAMGASDANDRVGFPVEGIDGGSVSMLSVMWSSAS